jgi:16S rRNA (cytosine967-C5)-methyltransferase
VAGQRRASRLIRLEHQVYAGPPLSRLLDLCADAVAAVQGGRSLTDVLARVSSSERPGVQALTFHVLRWLGGANAARVAMAPKTPPPRVEALLTSAIALLWPVADPPYPDHTLVDQAVTAAHQRTPAAAGFVNAVLRRFLRERAAIVEAARRSPEAAWNHPAWWIDRLRRDWPAHWQAILESSNDHPPMTLRVNARQGSARHYVEQLGTAGRRAWAPSDPALGGQAVVLETPCSVGQLPGFAAGEVSVQDASAQRAAPLLLGPRGLPPRARVLDACAAPGGKTAHLLEAADLDLLAIDSDPQRLARVQETLVRLHLQAELKPGDARDPQGWWDGRPFDAILLDAPCTASGIVRRHPDVRWLRRASDVGTLAQIQAAMLDALWPLLKPGGRLLYATCSVFKAEGQEQIDAFLQRLPPGQARLDPASPGHLLPLPDNGAHPGGGRGAVLSDGFFYALIHKP